MHRLLISCLLATLVASGARAQTSTAPAAAGSPATCAQPDAPHVTDWAGVAHEATEVLSQYIRVNTANPPGNELQAALFFGCIFEREGIPYTIFETAPGKANLVAHWDGTGSARPIVLLNHLDVVPVSREYWSVDPFAGLVRDGYVWGRGALDMKGVAVAQLLALLTLKREGVRLTRDVLFVATTDEETGGAGAADVVEHHFEALRNAEFVINEGGDVSVDQRGHLNYFGIGTTEKSPFWITLVARGPAGHGSQPRVNSAPNRLVRALERVRAWRTPITLLPVVERYFRDIAPVQDLTLRPLFANMAATVRDSFALQRVLQNPYHNALLRNTVSITVLQGSNKTNVIPPEAHAELDVRLLPGENPAKFIAALRSVIADDSVDIKPQGVGWPATVSPTDSPLFRALQTVALKYDPNGIVTTPMLTGFTDCHYFRTRGMACYGVDPFRITEQDSNGVHGNDERVSIENLGYGVHYLYDVLKEVSRP